MHLWLSLVKGSQIFPLYLWLLNPYPPTPHYYSCCLHVFSLVASYTLLHNKNFLCILLTLCYFTKLKQNCYLISTQISVFTLWICYPCIRQICRNSCQTEFLPFCKSANTKVADPHTGIGFFWVSLVVNRLLCKAQCYKLSQWQLSLTVL